MPTISDSLDSLTGAAVLIRALCRAGVGDERAVEDLSELSKSKDNVASIATNHLSLFNLRRGEFSAWKSCYDAEGEDMLSEAMRKQAWMKIPVEVELTSEELVNGLLMIDDSESPQELSWALLAAQVREEKIQEAFELVSTLNITEPDRMALIIELMLSSSSGDELAELMHRVEVDIEKFSDEDILLILKN